MHSDPDHQLFLDSSLRKVHFVGICGVAMASVAAELKRAGFQVTGSDKGRYPPMSDFLERAGIEILDGYHADHLPEKSLIVIGNAVSRGNPELETALDYRLPVISLPELVSRRYLLNRRNFVVAGTHGKSTITAMIAHILKYAGRKPGWLVGGVSKDLPYPCENGGGEEFVIEGDEYDSVFYDKRPKFMHYRPYFAVLNSVEFDHSDIYENTDAIENAFRKFMRLLPKNGGLIVNGDDALALSIGNSAPCRKISFGANPTCDWQLTEFNRSGLEAYKSIILSPGKVEVELDLSVFGLHNHLNALAAVAAAWEAGVDLHVAVNAINDFKGMRRRLELVEVSDDFTLYDDFAHHPTAIRATIEAVRKRHPFKRIWAIVEPRSNTMVKNFFTEDLTDSLEDADISIIGYLHRAERAPAESRLDRKFIVDQLEKRGKIAFAPRTNDEILSSMKDYVKSGDVFVIMTNGNFNGLKDRIVDIFFTETKIT